MVTVIEAGGRLVVRDARVVRAPFARMRGLLGRPPLVPGEALVVLGARQVHTVGLSYALDVAFCSDGGKVLHVVRGLRPYRCTRWVAGAHFAVETVAGALGTVRVDDALVIRNPSASGTPDRNRRGAFPHARRKR